MKRASVSSTAQGGGSHAISLRAAFDFLRHQRKTECDGDAGPISAGGSRSGLSGDVAPGQSISMLTADVGKSRSLASVGMTNGRGGDAANPNATDRNPFNSRKYATKHPFWRIERIPIGRVRIGR